MVLWIPRRFRTGSKCWEPPRCPAVITMDTGLLSLFDGQVQLDRQAAARAPEPVVVRLDGDAAGWLLLRLPFFLAPAACWWARRTGGQVPSARSAVTF